MTYRIRITPRARRQLERDLPEAAAWACLAFINGAVAENPYRAGKQLRPPLFPLFSARRGSFRVIYAIHDDEVVVEVVRVDHRRDVYRP